MKMIKMLAFVFVTLPSLQACKKSESGSGQQVNTNKNLVKGADIGWLTEMEAAGKKFYNSAGVEQDCIQILKDLGMNAVRLRVWVNPQDGWNGTADVVKKAVRAKNMGMKIMLDFHYSDTWADPGQQTKPVAWAALNFPSLKQALADHTSAVLNTLKYNGVTPNWVQVGNETNNGMLWPDGMASNSMSNFAQLVEAGYKAIKAVDTSIKVIVHVPNGSDTANCRWIFDGLRDNGAHWDIVGMSMYGTPADWPGINARCLANMNNMVEKYNKDMMIVETGMSWDQPTACYSYLADLIDKMKSVSNNRGLGVFYWEPECYNWKGYSMGAFDNSGKPTVALNAFK